MSNYHSSLAHDRLFVKHIMSGANTKVKSTHLPHTALHHEHNLHQQKHCCIIKTFLQHGDSVTTRASIPKANDAYRVFPYIFTKFKNSPYFCKIFKFQPYLRL